MSALIFLSVYLFICNKTCVAAIVGIVAVVININNTIIVGCLRGYLSGARCRLAYGPADATVSCFSKIQIGFAFLVPAHPGSPGQRAVKRVYVCMYS